MRIQHNIMAMNAYRNYNNNTSALSKNLEKLSSGYKINRAGDDAAGLAISEKMRAQITGLNAAQKNVKDGISLVKTAEGAMQEIQDMLNRMDYLATQSANGTYDDPVDRANLQKEVNALRDEINRIADSANFNGINLLDGSLSGKGATSAVKNVKLDGNLSGIKQVDATKWTQTTGATTLDVTAVTGGKVGEKLEMRFNYTENGQQKTTTISFTLAQNAEGDQYLIGGSGAEYSLTGDKFASAVAGDMTKAFSAEIRKAGLDDKFTFTTTWGTKATVTAEAKEAGVDGARLVSIDETVFNKDGTVKTTTKAAVDAAAPNPQGVDAYTTAQVTTVYDGTNQKDAVFTVNGKKYLIAIDGTDVTGLDKGITVIFGDSKGDAIINAASKISQDTGLNVGTVKADGTDDTAAATVTGFSFKAGSGTSSKGGLTLQIGDTADSFNQLNVVVGDMHTRALGIDGIDISNLSGAQDAISAIKDAINQVSSVRGDLGAVQNRLEHTQKNLSVMAENIQDAESTIRDTDVAEEMMSYTKNNILIQSAQAMLAQANAVPQGVLQLLG